MRDAARDAAAFVHAHERAELDANRWFGLVKWLEIVGEAAARVSPDLQRQHADVPWREITGMRHRLVHAYDRIDRDLVWNTAWHDLPPLVDQLEAMLATLSER